MLNQRIMVTAIIKKGNKFLLLKRSRNNKMYSGQWQFPEGGIKFGEEPLMALKRELREETGLKVKRARLLGVVSSNIEYFHKRIWHFIRLMYAVEAKGEIKLSKKHNEWKWVSKSEIKKLKLLKGLKYADFSALLK